MKRPFSCVLFGMAWYNTRSICYYVKHNDSYGSFIFLVLVKICLGSIKVTISGLEKGLVISAVIVSAVLNVVIY